MWSNRSFVTSENQKTLIKFVKDRPGHDRRYAIDASRIMSQLGWSPSVSFEQAWPGPLIGTLSRGPGSVTWRQADYQKYYESMYGNR